MIVCIISAFSAYAANPIDPTHDSSLTLHYQHNDHNFEGLSIKTFRVAEVFADGTYALCGDFKDYPVSIYSVTSQAEWKNITSTLVSYIVADRLVPTATQTTDKNGAVCFENLLPGMYLTLSVKAEEKSKITTFYDFLTVIPQQQDGEAHNYHVTSYPKCEVQAVTPKETEYKVVKQWKDSGQSKSRPESIEIEILKDGNLAHTQVLSAKNDWCFRWTAEADGGVWTAVERNVPKGYTVTVTQNGTTFLITNAKENTSVPPYTGDSSVIWPYIVAMAVSGLVLVLLAIYRKRVGV